MKKQLPIILILIAIISGVIYYNLNSKLEQNANNITNTFINIDKIRFSSKITSLSHNALSTFLQATNNQDKKLLKKAINFYDATIGFMFIAHVKNDLIIKNIKPLVEKAIVIIENAQLNPKEIDIKQLSDINKQIDQEIEKIVQNHWMDIKQNHKEFIVEKEHKFNLQLTALIVISLLLLILIYFMIKNQHLLDEKIEQKKLIDRQSKNAKIGYWTINCKNNNILWSKEVLKIYGLKKQPKNNNIFTLKQNIHPEDYKKVVQSLEKAKLDSNYNHDIQYRIVKDDKIVWVHCQGKLNTKNNMLEGTLQDITLLKNTIDELEKQKELLLSQSKSAMMGDMIGLIAHQFKQPLSVMSMISSTQEVTAEFGETISNDKIIEDAKLIDGQIQYLSSTIDTFKDFLKSDKKMIVAKVEDSVENALNIVHQSLISNNIELIKDYNSNKEINLYHSELMQVFINLLNNSKDAFKINEIKNRQIWIRTSQEDKHITIEIEDTAGGIDEDKIANIFDAYFTTKQEFNGTGLGLYIVKIIVEEHLNGTIKASNTNDGVKFTITI